MDGYLLYKKVFNSIYISQKIYSFVKLINNWEEDGYSIYDQTLNSFKYKDANIERVLVSKQFKLFDDMCQFYFSIARYNKTKYWYGQIVLDSNDLKELLGYSGLGFDRFILFFNEFNLVFFNNKLKVLAWCLKGGNIKIYKYLKYYSSYQQQQLQQRQQYQLKSLQLDQVQLLNQDYLKKEKSSSSQQQQQQPYQVFKLMFIYISDFNLNNSIEIFEEVLSIRESYRLGNIYRGLLEKNQIDIVKYCLYNISEEREELIFRIIYKSFSDKDIKYANIIKNYMDGINRSSNNNNNKQKDNSNNKSKHNSSSIRNNNSNSNSGIGSNNDNNKNILLFNINSNKIISRDKFILCLQSMCVVDFNILKYYWNIGLWSGSFEYLSYCNLDIQEFKNEHKLMLLKYPTNCKLNFNSFEYLVKSKFYLKLNYDYLFKGLVVYIANELFDLEYLKYVIEFTISIKHPVIIPRDCYDSKLPIVQYLFSTHKPAPNEISNNNAFFGDLDTLKFYCKLVDQDPSYSCVLQNLLFLSLTHGFTNMVIYLVSNYKALYSSSIVGRFFGVKMKFEIFQILVNAYSKELSTRYVTQGLFSRFQPSKSGLSTCKYIHYYQKITKVQVEATGFLLYQDQLLLQQHLQLFGNQVLTNGAFSIRLLNNLIFKSKFDFNFNQYMDGLNLEFNYIQKAIQYQFKSNFIKKQQHDLHRLKYILNHFFTIINGNRLMVALNISKYKSFDLINYIINIKSLDIEFKSYIFVQSIFQFLSRSVTLSSLALLLNSIKINNNNNNNNNNISNNNSGGALKVTLDYLKSTLKIYSTSQLSNLSNNLNYYYFNNQYQLRHNNQNNNIDPILSCLLNNLFSFSITHSNNNNNNHIINHNSIIDTNYKIDLKF